MGWKLEMLAVFLVRPDFARGRVSGDDGKFLRAEKIGPGTAETNTEVGGMKIWRGHAVNG